MQSSCMHFTCIIVSSAVLVTDGTRRVRVRVCPPPTYPHPTLLPVPESAPIPAAGFAGPDGYPPRAK